VCHLPLGSQLQAPLRHGSPFLLPNPSEFVKPPWTPPGAVGDPGPAQGSHADAADTLRRDPFPVERPPGVAEGGGEGGVPWYMDPASFLTTRDEAPADNLVGLEADGQLGAATLGALPDLHTLSLLRSPPLVAEAGMEVARGTDNETHFPGFPAGPHSSLGGDAVQSGGTLVALQELPALLKLPEQPSELQRGDFIGEGMTLIFQWSLAEVEHGFNLTFTRD
jgi:hypothetical protein